MLFNPNLLTIFCKYKIEKKLNKRLYLLKSVAFWVTCDFSFFFFAVCLFIEFTFGTKKKKMSQFVGDFFLSLSYLLFILNFLLVVLIDNQPKISRLRETLNLLTNVDSSTDTKMDRNGQKKAQIFV